MAGSAIVAGGLKPEFVLDVLLMDGHNHGVLLVLILIAGGAAPLIQRKNILHIILINLFPAQT